MNNIRTIKSPDGVIRHIKEGKLHNANGPAIIHPDGTEEYYLNGFKLSKEDYKKRKKESVGLPWYKSGAGKARY